MMSRSISCLIGTFFLVAASAVDGQSVQTVPPALDAVEGNSPGNYIPLGAATGGTYLVLYAADQLTGIPAGSVITSLQMRQNNSTAVAWPASAATIADYQVRLAASPLTPSTISSTFASNMTNPVLVRSGVLNLGAGAYPGGANTGTTPEGWGPVIGFTTGYVYTGGVLAIEFRNGGVGAGSTAYADTLYSEVRAAGRGNIASPGETSGFDGAALVARLTFTTPTGPFQTGVTKFIVLGDTAMSRGSATSTSLLNLSPRTAQLGLDAGELRGLAPGSQFIGMGYRAGVSAAWPAANQSFKKYDIQLSRSNNAPGSLSDTIATNVGSDAVTVRSGALAVGAGALLPWPASPGYAPWSLEIPFANPYMYTGGPLLTVIRSDGVTGALSGEVDAIATTSPLYGSRLKARLSAASSTATTTTSALAYPIERFSVDAADIIPNSNATATGNNTYTAILRPEPISFQVIVSATELAYLPIGSQITGYSLRADGGAATYPATAIAFNEYQVWASTSRRHPNAASLTFADNEGADVVQVRSGPLAVPAGMFAGGGSINPFSSPIWFQRPFVYKGGDLCVTIRHSGSPGSSIPILDGSSDTTRTILRSSFGIAATVSDSDYRMGPVIRFGYNPSVVAPTSRTTTPGNDGYSLMYSAAGNVHQNIYGADQLTGLRIGSVITGVSFRAQSAVNGYATWPAADVNVNRFDITLSTSPRLPAAMSNTFAENIGADAVLVRSGALTIPAGAFPYVYSTTNPNEYRWFLQFTRPFVYRGGPLSMTIRNDSGAGFVSMYFDVLMGAFAQANGRWAYGTGADATVQTKTGFYGALAARFAFVPEGSCPADLNNDGVVDDGDFTVFLFAYNTLDCTDPSMALGCPADFNHDGVVDDADFSVFVLAYNELVCP